MEVQDSAMAKVVLWDVVKEEFRIVIEWWIRWEGREWKEDGVG